MTFGDTLRKLREARSLSLGELARAMGVTTVYLSRVELGKSTPLTFARTVEAARQLGVEPAVLLRVHPTLGPAFAAGEDASQAAVVTWLRTEVMKPSQSRSSPAWFFFSDVASAIERGEHRREETTP